MSGRYFKRTLLPPLDADAMNVDMGKCLTVHSSLTRTNISTEERQQDMCPICKTDRYLSPDMKFLVNPECYHKMCESCVDRIFAMGPAPCPYPKCGKTLRKNKFKTQIFDNIEVEREVDVRKRVSRVFNKVREDFDTLDDYNKYLEELEDIVFNIVNGVDVEATEQKLKEYEESNKPNIEENNAKRQKELEEFKEQEQRKHDLRMKKNLIERQIEQEAREMKELEKKEIINTLASGDGTQDATKAVSQVRKSMLKRSSARRKQLDEIMQALNSSRQAKGEDKKHNVPFTPFNGDRTSQHNFDIHDSYYDPFLDELKSKKEYIASGFEVHAVYDRVLTEAFTGLGCYIEQEKKEMNDVIV